VNTDTPDFDAGNTDCSKGPNPRAHLHRRVIPFVISVVRKIDQFSLHTTMGRTGPEARGAADLAGIGEDTDSTMERDFAVDSLQMQQTPIRPFNC
jgi:hypothetical protein